MKEWETRRDECAAKLSEQEEIVAACVSNLNRAKDTTYNKRALLNSAKSEVARNQDSLPYATSSFNEDPFTMEIAQMNDVIDGLVRKWTSSSRWLEEVWSFS